MSTVVAEDWTRDKELTLAEVDHITRLARERPDTILAVARRPDRYDAQEGRGTTANVHAYQFDPYLVAGLYILDQLRHTAALDLLDIGSPLVLPAALATQHRVHVIDVRSHPLAARLPCAYVQANAAALPYAAASFDVVTSICVLCHVGDGRYGDRLDPDGDYHMLDEIARVLRPGGRCLMMPGPVTLPSPVIIFNAHRVVTRSWLDAATRQRGLALVDYRVYSGATGQMIDETATRPIGALVGAGSFRLHPGLEDYGLLTLVRT